MIRRTSRIKIAGVQITVAAILRLLLAAGLSFTATLLVASYRSDGGDRSRISSSSYGSAFSSSSSSSSSSHPLRQRSFSSSSSSSSPASSSGWGFGGGGATNDGAQSVVPLAGKTVIHTTESRIPFIPDDDEADLDFITLTTLNNLLYARALGAKYRFTAIIDDPDLTAPGLKTHGIPPDQLHKGSYCVHPKWGIRPAQFCRMPILWDIFRQDPEIEYLVHVDSDALLRSTDISVQRHFDELSESQPIAFMNNGPWQPHTPCTGYYVMRRGRDHGPSPINDLAPPTMMIDEEGRAVQAPGEEQRAFSAPMRGKSDVGRRGWFSGWKSKARPAPRTLAADFLRLWWDQDWHLNLCDGELKDQCTLWTLLKYDLGLKKNPAGAAALFRKRGVLLLPEAQFHLTDQDQMILHRHHKIADRYGALLREWSWPEYPINNDPSDRRRLRTLLTEVDFRRANASAIAEEMWEVEGYHTQWREPVPIEEVKA